MRCKVCGKETTQHSNITCSDDCKEKFRIAKSNQKLKDKIGEEAYNNDTVSCILCGLRAYELTSHIQRTHGIKVADYRKEYNSPTQSERYKKQLSAKMSGDNNIVHKIEDRRTISPFSPHFYVKKGFSWEDAQEMAKRKQQETVENKDDSSYSTKIEFWLKKTGGDLVEAERLYKNRQTTFTKEKCIQELGEEKGLEKWQARQDKWMATLDAKSDEEKTRIYRAKMHTKSYSKISQTLFVELYQRIKEQYESIWFATKQGDKIEDTGANNEFVVNTGESFRFLDFYIEDIKCCVEFLGDYFHSDRLYKGNKLRDEIREKQILNTIPDMKIYNVIEHEYRKYPEREIRKCLEFIDETRRQYQPQI